MSADPSPEIWAICPYCDERVRMQEWFNLDLNTATGRLVSRPTYEGKHTCPPARD